MDCHLAKLLDPLVVVVPDVSEYFDLLLQLIYNMVEVRSAGRVRVVKSLQSHECLGELSLLLILLIFKLCECYSKDALLLIKVLDLSLRLLLNEDLHLGLQAREERLHIVWFQISSSQLVNLVRQLFDCKVHGVFV